MRSSSAVIGIAGKINAALARLMAAACLGGAIWAVPFTNSIHAAEIGTLAVSNSADTYYISFDAVVRAPAHIVYAQLTDYAHLYKLSSVITSITVEPSADGKGERVRSKLRGCVLLFCREIEQVEDVTEPDNHTIFAHMVPGQGDFAAGDCTWRITDEGDRTRLHYEASRRIAFWIPPVVGPWLIKHVMREDLESSVTALERIVNQGAGTRR